MLTLRTIPAIAPFWASLSTTGTVQPKEGIFYSRPSSDSVRFRWAGETQASIGPGVPVNFSATLSSDGGITFAYGAGNSDLQNSISVAGCNGALAIPGIPTVGLSPGHDTYVLGTYVKSSWTNATGLHFDPPHGFSSFPQVTLESPKNDDKVQDVLTVSGIAYDTDVAFARAYMLIDGVQFGSVTQNTARADFCAKQIVRNCPLVGFSANLLISSLAPGKHTFQLRALNARGAFVDAPAQPVSFTVEPGQGRMPYGKVEAPVAGTEVNGTLTVRGYAAIEDLRILSVDTLIDGITFGPTAYGVTRTDICGTLKPVPLNCPSIGFQLSINTRTGIPPIQDGEHALQIRVRDELGRLTMLPDSTVKFTVKNGVVQLPQGAITSIKSGDKLSGTVTLSGYAYSGAGPIRQVIVIYDNLFADLAKYGVASPAACESLKGVTACPNIGWTLDLDTKRLGNGNHIVTVQISDSTGAFTTLPSVGQPTVSFAVQN